MVHQRKNHYHRHTHQMSARKQQHLSLTTRMISVKIKQFARRRKLSQCRMSHQNLFYKRLCAWMMTNHCRSRIRYGNAYHCSGRSFRQLMKYACLISASKRSTSSHNLCKYYRTSLNNRTHHERKLSELNVWKNLHWSSSVQRRWWKLSARTVCTLTIYWSLYTVLIDRITIPLWTSSGSCTVSRTCKAVSGRSVG